MKKIAKMIIGGVGILIAVLFVANLFFYLFQDKILFQSKPLTQDFKFDFPQKFQEFFIPFGENEVINALFFPLLKQQI